MPINCFSGLPKHLEIAKIKETFQAEIQNKIGNFQIA